MWISALRTFETGQFFSASLARPVNDRCRAESPSPCGSSESPFVSCTGGTLVRRKYGPTTGRRQPVIPSSFRSSLFERRLARGSQANLDPASATGLRPHEYLLRRRIERTQEMLVGTGMSLVDVALSVGFQTQSLFTSVFKRYAGQPPRAWRESRDAQTGWFPRGRRVPEYYLTTEPAAGGASKLTRPDVSIVDRSSAKGLPLGFNLKPSIVD
jgi:hypothetical protein